MPTTKLKFKTLYGKSGASTAWRVHLLDLDFSKVTHYPGKPEATRYNIRWYCTTPSRKYPLQFIPMKQGPAFKDVCPTCIRAARMRIGLPNKHWEGGEKRIADAIIHPFLEKEYDHHVDRRRKQRADRWQSKNAPF